MQYDAAGNVTKIVDGVNSETIDYTYDELNRVLTASVPTGESFAYDTIGNMTSKAGTALDYGTTTPKHAVKSHGTTTYTYDANGSLTAKGTQTIKYDPEQRPIRVEGCAPHPPGGLRRRRRPPQADGRQRDCPLPGRLRAQAGRRLQLSRIRHQILQRFLRSYEPAGGVPPGRDSALGRLRPPGRHDQGVEQQLHCSRRDALQALRRGPGHWQQPEHGPQVHRPDRGRGRRVVLVRLPRV